MTGRPWQIVAAVGGAIIGIVAVRYLGLNAVIPALSVAACWWALTRLGVHRRLVLPLAFTGGHGIWFLVGMVMTLAIGGSVHSIIEVGLETLIIMAIVAWVYASQSKPSLLVLIAYEAVSIVFNAVTFTEVDDALRAVIAVHVGLRLVAIVGAALALAHRAEFAPESGAS
ncbi:MAG TPA: hypothetical protein VFE11_15265 [Dongiaceae bacterium]|jgi:hypothetical protein|nr:hypothetical protein [Dongiaceae bacterium]